MAYLIGIDIGTSGTKTVLFDESGVKLASRTVEYPLYQPHEGWAEQEPRDWWGATVEGIVAVTANIDKNEIRGIGLSGQMHGLVMLNGSGEVLRRSLIWCDQRTAKQCDEITERVSEERLMQITMSPALTGFTASKILWVRENEPDVYEKCKTILLPKDYIRFMLTGEKATEVSDASGMQLLDIAERRWSDDVLSALEIDKSLLGRVYESSDVTGVVSESASKLTGLPAGIPVVGGAGDNAASAIGCGVAVGGKAFTTIGTSGVVFAHSPEVAYDPKGRIHSFCSAVPGEWHVMGVVQSAGLSLRWFRDNFCAEEYREAERRGVDIYRVMDEYAARTPVGSNKLLYLPYLMGERTPHLDPYAKGAFIGLTARHGRHDMLRSVMEGVTFALSDSLSLFSAAGITVSEMMACGGGSSSPLWRQMLADVFNCRVETAASNEGGALGAALLAAAGTGIYGSVREACEEVIKVKDHCDPIPENAKIYAELYAVYTELYSKIKEDCRTLSALEF